MKKFIKRTGVILLIVAVLSVFFVWFANYRVESTTTDKVYNDIDKVPYNKVGMLLGSSKYLRGGTINPYFENRIIAAAELYKAGKISYIVVSGDNSRDSYNEPEDMRNALITQGIPDDKIYSDYAGFRTLDSVVRMNKIFGQSSFTSISQEFHNKRAIYIADDYEFSVVGYNAKDVSGSLGFKTNVREALARVKVFIDLFTGKNPKFLGEPIEIGSNHFTTNP